jgi:GT2 family glycosyltransferase
MTQTPLISVIIVNYKANREAQRVCQALSSTPRTEILVVDNSDGKHGYGAGCNAGARQAKGAYLVFLNPDIEISPATIQHLGQILSDKPDIGLVGPQIKRSNGSIEPTCLGIPTPWLAWWAYSWFGQLPFFRHLSDPYFLPDFDRQHSREVPSIAGCCLAMRKSDWKH